MRVLHLDTPHVPHNWDSRVLHEETTGTLLCGDFFTQVGNRGPLVTDNIVSPAIEAEDGLGYSGITLGLGRTLRRLADLQPATLALMHGPSYQGDGAAALSELADHYDERLRAALNEGALRR
jgi:hypothetical protein